MSIKAIFLLALLLVPASVLAGGLEVGKAGGGFTLRNGDATVSLAGLLDEADAKAVVVYVTSYICPYSLRADGDLRALLDLYAGRGVRFVAIYPNQQETAEGVARYGAKQGFRHLMLRDPDGAVARSFGAEVTPTFFLIDKTGYLRYRGNLSGLAAATDAVLEGGAVANPNTAATGCTVKWPDEEVPDGLPPDGPRGDAPAGETPREGPPEPPPPELSKEAQKWLKKLIKGLASQDPLVVRSASSAIMAFGPPVLPQLRAALEAEAEGPARRQLSRLIEVMASRGRPGSPDGRRLPGGLPEGGGPPGGFPGGRGEAGVGAGPAPRGSFLDRQRERLESEIDLTDDQKKRIDELFTGLKIREGELQKLAEEGDREAVREGFRGLMEEARVGLAEILTEEQRKQLEEMRGGFRGGRRGPGGGRERDR